MISAPGFRLQGSRSPMIRKRSPAPGVVSVANDRARSEPRQSHRLTAWNYAGSFREGPVSTSFPRHRRCLSRSRRRPESMATCGSRSTRPRRLSRSHPRARSSRQSRSRGCRMVSRLPQTARSGSARTVRLPTSHTFPRPAVALSWLSIPFLRERIPKGSPLALTGMSGLSATARVWWAR